jgi:hypothetical protein
MIGNGCIGWLQHFIIGVWDLGVIACFIFDRELRRLHMDRQEIPMDNLSMKSIFKEMTLGGRSGLAL